MITILLIVVGAILMWAFPNKMNNINVDLIGQILFWVGVVRLILFFVAGALGAMGVITSSRFRKLR